MSKKALCLVYDNHAELIADNDIRENLICITLGRDTANDGYGALYKIILKSPVMNLSLLEGFDLGVSSKYFALQIHNTNVTEILEQLKTDTRTAINDINAVKQSLDTGINNMTSELQKVLQHTSEIVSEYDLSGDGTVKVILTADWRRYLSITTQEATVATYSVHIDSANEWMIPRLFKLTPRRRYINDQVGIIDYDDTEKILIYRINVTTAREYLVIEY